MVTKSQLQIQIDDLEEYSKELQESYDQAVQSNEGLYDLVEHLQESSKYTNEFYKWVIAIHPDVVYEFEDVKDIERSVEENEDGV
jgi:FtsZ-binding cell division protein ZapB